MQKDRSILYPWLPGALILFVLGTMILFQYEWLFGNSYPGFSYSIFGGEIYEIIVLEETSELRIGDHITHIGSTAMEDYYANPYMQFWDKLKPGDIIPITVKRNEETIEINWVYPGFTQEALFNRLNSQWWLSYVFWAAGLVAFLNIRPRNTVSRLFIAFNITTALWFAAGSGPSTHHILGSSMVMRIGIWVIVPILIHLHWIFPRRFERISKRLERIILRSAYALSLVLIILSLIFPKISSTYQYGFLLSLLLSIFFLISHYVFQKDTREQIKIIFRITLLAFIPIILTIFLSLFTSVPPYAWGASMLGFPVIPISYFFAISRGKLGKFELRANRAISIYLYLLLLMAILLLTFTLIENRTGDNESFALLALLTAFLTAILTITFFPTFQRFIERKILNIPLPQTQLLQTYAAQITTSQDPDTLSTLLSGLILPSIMVRQSALISIRDQELKIIDQSGLQEDQLPTLEQFPDMLLLEGRYIFPEEMIQFPKHLNWIRVIFHLTFDTKTIGLWLLGQRDPNDVYETSLIEILQAIAHQTSMALTNQQQTQRLRALYQVNIDRHETERARLARELHDVTLNNLALLQLETKKPKISSDIEEIIANLRKTIHGLRPEMLSYGLSTAIQDLGDTLNERLSTTKVHVGLEGGPAKIDSNIELHLFRVVQQACENTLRHAKAKNLRITGEITDNKVHIQIEDDGIGFEIKSKLMLSNLLADKHYGLAGMHERVDLVGGKIEIRSTFEKGTEILINWPHS